MGVDLNRIARFRSEGQEGEERMGPRVYLRASIMGQGTHKALRCS